MGHHYVPQEYLRGFTHPSNPKGLWQYDKKTQTFSSEPAAISKIAQQRSFYDDNTERRLHELVEIPGNRVLQKLRSGNLRLTDEERANLSVYIATMLKRIPHYRAKCAAMAPQVLSNVISRSRDEIRALEHQEQLSSELAAERHKELDEFELECEKNIPDDARKEFQRPWPIEQTIEIIYRMQWGFVSACNDQYFVTTDNPAFFFECYGLGTENSEMIFPISSNLALFGGQPSTQRTRRAKLQTQLVKEANRRLIHASTRFIYYRSKEEWIPKVAAKENPHLSRIQWK